jgi:hypothetical protein
MPWQRPEALCLLVYLTVRKDNSVAWHPELQTLSAVFTRYTEFTFPNKGIEQQGVFQNFLKKKTKQRSNLKHGGQ